PISMTLLGFNPNEVAGALAWVVPVLAALALGNPNQMDDTSSQNSLRWIGVRPLAGLAFAITMLSLFLGQSRFAIAGVMGSIIIIILALVKNPRWKLIWLAGVATLI